MSSGSQPGERLERALAAFLSGPPATRSDEDTLLRQNPDLADLLAPMLARDAGDDPGTDAAGERVLGDFRLVRELGRGGMGIVYEAWQRSLDRRVAVKVLAPALVANPSAVARFRREASAAGRVRHPNIVEVFGFGSDGGEHFFAMQFVDGAPLHNATERFREPIAAVGLAAQLADALVHAHQAGLVHRDVKPGNVLVRADGVPLLTDFGVARDTALPSLTRDGGFVGTLDYASPEQVRGEEIDARCDVWALGVILYELLTGTHPFTAATQEATMHRILTSDPPPLQGRPGISDDLAAIVDRALTKNRTRRYASAAAMLADLRALQHGEAVSVRLPTGVERLQRWATREPWRAFAAAMVLLGVPTLSGVLGYLWANQPRIAAATNAELRSAREELLSNALVYLADGDPRSGLAVLAAVDEPDDEVAILRALLHMRRQDEQAAREALAGRQGPIFDLVRRFVERPQGLAAEPEAPPEDAFECFVRAHILFDGANHRGRRSRPLLLKALELARLATVLAPSPRLNYLTTLASAADLAEDRATLRSAGRAIETHFAASEVGLFVRARCLVRHDPEAALALLDRLDRAHGPTARTQAMRAVALEYAGKVEEATAANRAAIAAEPGYHLAWMNLGVCLRKQKQYEESTAALRKAVEINPNYAPGWNVLGLTLRDAGQPDEAAAAFTEALERTPDYGAAALNLGNLHVRKGDYTAAADAFRRAAAAEPDNVRAVANLGDALSRLGRQEEALQYSLRAAMLAPNDLIPNYNVARLALTLKLPKLALGFAARAREAGKQNPNGLAVHAEALLAQDPVDGPQALAAARAADLASKGGDVEVRILVGRALAANGDRDGAVKNLQEALADPRFGAAAAQSQLEQALAAVRGK